MGNFLFQAAAAMGYAWRHGLDFTPPSITNDRYWNPLYLQHLVNPKFNPNLRTVSVQEGLHCYQELPFREEWREKNIILDGYWQTEKYFKGFRDKILNAFGYSWEPRPNTCSVHVRRGDYLTIQRNGMFKHPPVSKEWIFKVMSLFPGYRFLIFSDDTEWCLRTFGGMENCVVIGGTNEEQDLVGMSCCEHHICSASTFSWWGAWLNRNPNKRIIMPAHWITPGWRGGIDCSDIVPAEWERLP